MLDSAASEIGVYAAVRRAVLDLTGLGQGQVIFDRPSGPRPTGPYVMLNVISAERVREMGARLYEALPGGADGPGEGEGEGDAENPSEPGPVLERRAQDWEWVVSVNVYGPQALDTARYLTNATRVPGVALSLFAPLTPRATSLVRRIPELVLGTWEARAQFDLTVAGTVLDGFPVEVMERGRIVVVRPFDIEMPIDVGIESPGEGE